MIAQDVPQEFRPSLIRSCKRLYYIVTRVQYKEIEVQDREARLLFAIVASPLSTTIPYGKLIRSLTFVATTSTDIYLSFTICCDALLQMTNLISLNLLIPRHHTRFLLTQMRKTAIISAASSPVQALPRLRNFGLQGDVQFAGILRNRPIVQFHLTEPVGYADLTFLQEVLSPSQPNTDIREICLTFEFIKPSRTIFAIQNLAKSFPKLQHLSIYVSTLNGLVSFFFWNSMRRPHSNQHFLALFFDSGKGAYYLRKLANIYAQ